MMALLFAFHVNYVPVHLATATHLDEAVAAVLDSVLHLHDHGHTDVPADKSDDGHTPHPAADHDLTFAAQNHAPVAALLMVFVSTETTLQLLEPEASWSTPVIERIKPTGESPPDPAQPRAPPIA